DVTNSSEVRTILQVTTIVLGDPGVDNEFGHGRVNAVSDALLAYDPGKEEPATESEPETTPVFNGSGHHSGSVSSRTVSLKWSDNSNVEEGFQIEYGVKAKGRITWYSWASVGTDVTSYSSSMKTGTYVFRVRAFKDNTSSFTN